jgi:hypothetical protein
MTTAAGTPRRGHSAREPRAYRAARPAVLSSGLSAGENLGDSRVMHSVQSCPEPVIACGALMASILRGQTRPTKAQGPGETVSETGRAWTRARRPRGDTATGPGFVSACRARRGRAVNWWADRVGASTGPRLPSGHRGRSVCGTGTPHSSVLDVRNEAPSGATSPDWSLPGTVHRPAVRTVLCATRRNEAGLAASHTRRKLWPKTTCAPTFRLPPIE